MKSTVVQPNSWHTGAGIEGTGRNDWREERWETEELKGWSAAGDRDGSYRVTHT